MVRIYDRNRFDKLFQEKSIRGFRVSENESKICIAYDKRKYIDFDYPCPHQKHPLKEEKITSFTEVVCPLA